MILRWSWILLVAIGQVTSGPSNDVSIAKNTSYIDILKQALDRQIWDSDDKPCWDTMILTLNEAQNFTLWAVWALDSLELPHGVLYGRSSSFGNYDECLSPRKGFDDSEGLPKYKYCLTALTLTDLVEDGPFSKKPDVTADLYLKKKTDLRRNLAYLRWGLCVPDVCQPQSIGKIARAVLQTSHLRYMDQTTSIEVKRCESRIEESTPKEYTLGYYIFIITMIMLPVITIWFSYRVSIRKAPPESFASEFARSFCIKRNMEELTKVRDNEIYSMNFMRNISMYLLIISHEMMMFRHLVINALDLEDIFKANGGATMHMDLLTDTFFTISGLLFLRGMFTDKNKSPLKYMWKRYVRLITALAVLVAYACFVFEHTGEGPIWDDVVGAEARHCRATWLLNFLMVFNIVDAKRMCILLAWYVPTDFQLSVVIAVLFCIYQKNKKAAAISFWVIFAIGILWPAYSTYVDEYYVLPFDGLEFADIRLNKHFIDHYIRPTSHLGPFMLGAIMGFFMYTYKPKDHRKCISKLKSYIAILAALVVMAASIGGGGYYYMAKHEDRVSLGAAVYGGVNRSLWGAAICLVVAVSEYGDIPFLQSMFSWFPLVPLSRLTYEAYLLQYPVILTLSETARAPMKFDQYQHILISTGVTVVCYVGGLFIWLFVEAPIININNMLLYKTWKKEKPVPVAVNEKQE